VRKISEKSLLDLLPKGGNSLVDSLQNEGKYLRRILFLIQEAEEGIQHFLKGNLSHFDPHVGDTACQIRAYYFALLWTKREAIFPSLERDLSQLKKYAEKVMILIDQGDRNEHQALRPCLLTIFLEELGLSLSLSAQGLVLVIGHVLSEYAWRDEEGISQKIDKLKLQNVAVGLGRSFLVEWIQGLQRKLAEISVAFIEDLAVLRGMPLGDRAMTPKAVEVPLLLPGGGGQGGGGCAPIHSWRALMVKDRLGRPQWPCLLTFDTLSEALQRDSSVLMGWVIEFRREEVRTEFFREDGSPDSISLFFRVEADSTWKFIDWSEISEETPLFILRGFTHLESREAFVAQVKPLGPINLVNYTAADHPQYAGVEGPVDFPPNYDDFYQKTLESARRYKVGWGNFGELLVAFKHVLCARAGEFLALSASWPRLNIERPLGRMAEIGFSDKVLA
jgi:hypothetical protein